MLVETRCCKVLFPALCEKREGMFIFFVHAAQFVGLTLKIVNTLMIYTGEPTCVGIWRLAGARHVSRRVMNTVTRGWVGAPNERAPFRFHDAVVVFADRCLSRARNISDLNWTLLMGFSQTDLGPTPAQEIFFSVFFRRLDLFKWGFVLIASGT